ncbi:MAG TPA: ankyrin repeat domain-containing protein [Planctomicrobium sp.]|nr:ankyrin repeat domain-containing protein [Planctomicrobium sp.]
MTLAVDPYSVEEDEWPPLWAALLARDLPTAGQLIRSGACLDDMIEPCGSTFLHRAVQANDITIVEFFLEHGARRSLESFDEVEHTPLMWASERGHLELVSLLLSAGANPNAHNEAKSGNTALREAVRNGHRKVVKLLLDAGGDPTISGWMGISAVDQAYLDIEGGLDSQRAERIRHLLANFPSSLRNRQG